ncbi:hypothetical protein, partial [Streptomyces sp. NPDC051014]|uniref:hypothetical protein n=1 Tax=Streptomyces sp. NPDC051014 TaxID=3155751 RepID=UPI0033EAE3F5
AVEPLTDLDKQLIGTLLKHPTTSQAKLASAHGQTKHVLQTWLQGLGLRLGKPGSGRAVAQYVRSNQADVLAQAGFQPGDTLPTLSPDPGAAPGEG